jgi:hypothetical protein
MARYAHAVAGEEESALRLEDSQKREKRTQNRWYDAEVLGTIACPSSLAAVATPGGPVQSADREAVKPVDCQAQVAALVVGCSRL